MAVRHRPTVVDEAGINVHEAGSSIDVVKNNVSEVSTGR